MDRKMEEYIPDYRNFFKIFIFNKNENKILCKKTNKNTKITQNEAA